MIRSPLQHHRSRVPAIPPKTGPQTFRFAFDRFDVADVSYSFGSQNPALEAFLQAAGLNRHLRLIDVFGTSRECQMLHETLRQVDIQILMKESPAGEITLTVTRPARLSPKLLATFPWKLRRLQSRT